MGTLASIGLVIFFLIAAALMINIALGATRDRSGEIPREIQPRKRHQHSYYPERDGEI